MSDTYSIGILTVSDRCFRGEAEDESGPYLRKVIEDSRKLNNPNFVIKCVPDEVPEIEETLKEWADVRKLDAVFTTGGTGFAPRDVTPEATRNVIEKEAPSIASAILYHTLAKTKMAMLSRSVCGIRKRCLIINFPGSKKAVGECLDVVIDCIPHALSLLRNDTLSVTATHQALQAAVKSKVDVTRVARRARESTFPMVDVEQSLQITSKIVAEIFSLSSEKVPIEKALGRVMTEPAAATCSLPPYRASVMDGYAAISSDGLGPREVVSAMVAGSQPLSGGVLRSGQCARVNTGAPVLPGADCVVKVEDTRVLQETSGGREELRIDVLVAPTPGQYIREIGSDVKEGDIVLQVSQTPITSSQVGLLASVGIFSVPVYRLPRVALLSTGNELQLPGHKLEPGQIWDSNKIMLLSLLKENGFPAVDLGIAKDEQDETLAKLKEGMEFADVIVTTGSVSMGDRDLLKQILKEDLNAEIHFGRVNLKPGKPTTFATCQGPKNRPILFFCLPGNPVSAIVTCHLYVLPSLRYLSGQKQLYSQIVKAQEVKMAPVKRKQPSEKSLAERREAKKLSMRRAREKLKSNPEQHDEAKKKDRERKKVQRKKIDDMTEREKRKVRMQWKACSQMYRDKNKMCNNILNNLEENTPPSSPVQFDHQAQNDQAINPNPSNSRIFSGKKIRRKNKEKMKKDLKTLQEENKKLQKKVNKYRKRLQRAKINQATDQTPRKKVAKMLKGENCSNEVRRSLIFAEVLKKQVKTNYLAETKQKKKMHFATVLTGKIVKKYRFTSCIASWTSSRIVKLSDKIVSARSLMYKIQLKKDITEFFEQDEISRQCAGKKETITRGKIKMQKRLLNDSLKNLHMKFVSCYEDHKKLSYSFFCKMRPFWILIPNCRDRETCLCHLHTNFSLIVMKLNKVGIINERMPDDVLKSITCDRTLKEKCLERRCKECKNKIVTYLDYDETDSVEFQQWIKIDKLVQIKGKMKVCKKTSKEKINCNKSDLVIKFENLLKTYAAHVCNIKHQYSAIKHIKKNLKNNEVLLHVDFSENYSCKFGEEIQSYHFRGSRQQVSLYTSVLYNRTDSDDDILTTSFCTISENCRHDSLAICAHLNPIFSEIKKIVPNLKVMHFFSDGPTNQYRNRKMFVLAAKLFAEKLKVEVLHWHYSESGHGKGAPDGIGGCLKRQADNIVAQGVDIPNMDTLLAKLKETCKGITLIQISEEEISQYDSLAISLPKFKGTLKVHEIKWCQNDKDVVEARRLTCESCYDNEANNDEDCPHYLIGVIDLKDSYDQAKVLPEQILDHPNEQPGPSENSGKKMARKCSPRQERKLHYSDVYSDNSDLEETYLKVNVNDFVITKIMSTKNTIHNYVGMVVKKFNDEFLISFLKKKYTTNLFVFPEKEDTSHVELSEIVAVLNPPSVKRGQYHFDDLKNHNISA